jgi:hypothetical protein
MTGRDLYRPGPAVGLTALPLAVTALAVFAGGGYPAGARVAFGAAAITAAAAVIALEKGWPFGEPVVVVLLALAVLGALSALWTLGPVDRTLRWALVCAGYAGVAVAAAVAARQQGGVEALAAGLAALAVVAGAAGLVAAVTLSTPYAERIAGVWRPGGPFEYPPALALLEVSALPVLLAAVTRRSALVAAGGAVGMAVAGGVLALSASRVSLAMAVAVGGLALFLPRVRSTAVAGALGLGLVAGLALQVYATPGALVAVLVLAGPVWLVARRALGRFELPRLGMRPAWVVAGVLILAVLAGSLAFGSSPGRGAGAAGGYLHGRASTWESAVETFADRPLAGAGADAFLAGSARHQHGQTVVFAHDLPIELGAELGAGGLALAVGLYLAIAHGLWRVRGTTVSRLLGPAAVAFPVANLVDWPWHLAGAGAVWAVAIGALAGAAPRGEKVPELRIQGDS